MLNKRYIKEFKNNGVVVVRNFLSKGKTKELEKKLNHYIKSNKNKLKGKDINFINGKVNSLHKIKGKYFSNFCKSKKIFSTVENLIDIKPKFKHCEYFAKPAKVGLASPMHQDNYYWNLKNPNAVTMWVALSPANHKNGSLEYLVGSHKLGKVKHVASYAPGSSQKVKDIKKFEKKFKKKIYNLDVGDCLIHHSEVIHGSQKNESKISRKGFTIQIMDKDTDIDKQEFKKYQLSLKKQIKLRS